RWTTCSAPSRWPRCCGWCSPARASAPRWSRCSACRCRRGRCCGTCCSPPGRSAPRCAGARDMLAPASSGYRVMNVASTPFHEAAGWSPDSWQRRTALQQPQYADAAELARATAQLARLPPLVTSWEVLALKQALAEAQEGRRFLLQGGDCAESFADCTSPIISNRLKVLLQMSLVLVHGLKKPVLRVGRFAGQYAKPRSADTETRDGVTLPSFRGDLVNSPEFTPEARRADPQRLIQAHAHSALTMNF